MTKTTKATKNLFAFGKNNRQSRDMFLHYIKTPQKDSGLCSFLWGDNKAYDFLNSQIKIIQGKKKSNWYNYPVESAVYTSKHKKKLNIAQDIYGFYAWNDNTNDNVKLRIWWAYNMAVAISKQNEDV